MTAAARQLARERRAASAGVRNVVVEGDYRGRWVLRDRRGVVLLGALGLLTFGLAGCVRVSAETVTSLRLTGSVGTGPSAASTLVYTAAGGLLAGGAGALIGAAYGATRRSRAVWVALGFADGKNCVAEMDEETFNWLTKTFLIALEMNT